MDDKLRNHLASLMRKHDTQRAFKKIAETTAGKELKIEKTGEGLKFSNPNGESFTLWSKAPQPNQSSRRK